MEIHRVIEGTGFGAGGPEDNYLFFIDGAGETSGLSATELIPEDATAGWAYLESLVGGFGSERSQEKLTTRFIDLPKPRAYRMRITVEVEPLTDEETEKLFERARTHNLSRDADLR